MPRPILRQSARATGQHSESTRQTGNDLKIRTGPRSRSYLAALRDLDLHTAQRGLDIEAMVAAVRQEFQETWSQLPIGLVSHCYLGYPYETHMLSIDGGIIEHFERHQSLPGPLDRARPYARTEQYEVIEVYPDRLICVRPDGTTMTLEG